MSTVATARRPRVVLGLVASLAAQLAMIAVGLWAVVLEEDAENTIGLLATWCAIGTVYEIVVLIVLGVPPGVPRRTRAGPRASRWAVSHASSR